MAGTQFLLHVHLRAWRKSLGLTLEGVSLKIDAKPNTISGWETGNRKVDLYDLAKLAKVYGVTPAALLYAPEGSPELAALQETSAIVRKMKPKRLRTWLDTGHALAEDDDAT